MTPDERVTSTRRACLLAGAAAWLTACSRPDPPPKAHPIEPDRAYSIAQGAEGFEFGLRTTPVGIYVFFDSQCDYCADLWKQSQPLRDRVKMKWIPVGLLNSTSVAQGAAIIASETPVEAMHRYHGISPAPTPSAEDKRKIEANTQMLQTFGAKGVPFLVYKHAKTAQFGYASGTMSTEQLATLAGI